MDVNNNRRRPQPKAPKPWSSYINLFFIAVAVLLFGLYIYGDGGSVSKKVTYTEFKDYVEKGYVEKIVAYNDNTLDVSIKKDHVNDVFKGMQGRTGNNPVINVQIGSQDAFSDFMDKQEENGNFSGSIRYEKKNDYLGAFFWNIFPFVLIVAFWIFVMRRMNGPILYT